MAQRMADTTRTGVLDFLREVMEQLRKVTWPDKDQLRNSTSVILVFMVIVAAVIFVMDRAVDFSLTGLRSLLTG
jgi:preprotein translocase subunit SecE